MRYGRCSATESWQKSLSPLCTQLRKLTPTKQLRNLMQTIKKYKGPLLLFAVFEAIAITLWLLLGKIFYFFNFTYIGACVAIGVALFIARKSYARKFTQFAVGLYMLAYLGFMCKENMQIEGFWYYLFLGVFQGATIHYVVAKLIGPVLFGRGWCGYACWTAMVLDLLPWKQSAGRKAYLGAIRYVLLILSLVLVLALMFAGVASDEVMFVAFIVGNVSYYAVGIALAFALRDNRAFCKYICPIGILMKPAASVSRLRITCNSSLCVQCKKCLRVCPMDVYMLDNSRKRKNNTECILCFECVKVCPKDALKF